MKTLFVGDLHLKARVILPFVETIIDQNNIGRIIFLGDFVDFHGQENNAKLYAKDLIYLYDKQEEWRDKNIEIVNLVGNHDIYYLLGLPAPFSLQPNEAFHAVQSQLEDLELQVAYQLDDILVSHAGYNIIFDTEPWHFKPLDLENEEKLEIYSRAVGPMRGGPDFMGSPVWADFREMELIPNEKYPKQVVGHTPREKIDSTTPVIGVDTFTVYPTENQSFEFVGNGDLLMYEDGVFEVIKTNWQSPETYKLLENIFTSN